METAPPSKISITNTSQGTRNRVQSSVPKRADLKQASESHFLLHRLQTRIQIIQAESNFSTRQAPCDYYQQIMDQNIVIWSLPLAMPVTN